MKIAAIIIGVVAALEALSGNDFDNLIMFFYLSKLRSRSAFEEVYSNADNAAAFSQNNKSKLGFKSYAEFLHFHQAARETAYDRFRRLYARILRRLSLWVFPELLFPAILFWKSWYFYYLSESTIIVLFVIHRVLIKKRPLGYYRRLLIGWIITSYMKNNQPI